MVAGDRDPSPGSGSNFYSVFPWLWWFLLFRSRPILESIMLGACWSSARANCMENWISEQLRISFKSFPRTRPRLHFCTCIFAAFFVFSFFHSCFSLSALSRSPCCSTLIFYGRLRLCILMHRVLFAQKYQSYDYVLFLNLNGLTDLKILCFRWFSRNSSEKSS